MISLHNLLKPIRIFAIAILLLKISIVVCFASAEINPTPTPEIGGASLVVTNNTPYDITIVDLQMWTPFDRRGYSNVTDSTLKSGQSQSCTSDHCNGVWTRNVSYTCYWGGKAFHDGRATWFNIVSSDAFGNSENRKIDINDRDAGDESRHFKYKSRGIRSNGTTKALKEFYR